MARNGSGTYSLVSGNPVVTGTTISSTTHNNTNTDLETALTDSVAKNGETVMTGALDFNGQGVTDTGAITANADSTSDIGTTTKRYKALYVDDIVLTGGITEGAAWTTPAFSAGDFTASASMTWTVASGDVETYAYIINGKMMTVLFGIITSTVGGTPAATLNIAIPASKVATKTTYNALGVLLDNNVNGRGYAAVAASGSIIQITRNDGVNMTASTDLTFIRGQITFEIN